MSPEPRLAGRAHEAGGGVSRIAARPDDHHGAGISKKVVVFFVMVAVYFK
jgi:hypothetical protein